MPPSHCCQSQKREICEAAVILRELNVDYSSYVSETSETSCASNAMMPKMSEPDDRTVSLLVHTSACVNPACPSQSCARMKALLEHTYWCSRMVSTCTPCRRVWTLLKMHAATCSTPKCPVLTCRLRMFG